MVLSLQPAPTELKSITPYLQRADEIASTDPVISYWCAYYAAQQGIALKLKDSPARHYLFDLLGLLERMKMDIGPNDAVHDEPASAAYVENFALRIFASADNEDRSGRTTRNTAKKFLAAANFLELLRIFDTEKAALDLPSIEEKIKYAKWKAADIAKTIREGRKPIPGPAASDPTPIFPSALDLPDVSVIPPATPPSASVPLNESSPPAIVRPTPPPPQLSGLPTVDAHLPDGLAPHQLPQSPGSWSTIATPGTPGFHLEDSNSPASSGPPEHARKPPMAYVSGELEGKTEDEINAEWTPPSPAAKSVHFSPSVVGGQETPSAVVPEQDPFAARVIMKPPSALNSPSSYPPNLPSVPPPPPPGPMTSTHSARSPPRPAPPAPPSSSTFYSHVSAYNSPSGSIQTPDHTTSTVTTTPAELSPQLIARVQKHCRFAISALDYEDQEQAVKELREALRMLGG